MTKIFVASPVEVYEGDSAIPRLEQTNDSRFATARGVVGVDQARWQQAQQYERDTWLRYNLDARSDRNEAHRDGFAGYAALPENVDDIVELGCGPFTNVRYIVDGHKATSLTLLDPLLDDYEREHPNCAYQGWKLYGYTVDRVSLPIERWQTERRFDTLVMINTLPHCFSADDVFTAIRRVLKPDGVLVFHETGALYAPTERYDVGHPIAPQQAVIDEFLSAFETLYQNGAYFIGRLS